MDISTIDGAAGTITIRNQPLEHLADTLDFEGMIGHLWQIPRPDLGPTRVHMRPLLKTKATNLDELRAALANLPGELTPLEAVAAIQVALTDHEPDPTRSHADDFLRAGPDKARALNKYLVTVAEHGLNASTYTARVVASTRAGVKASVIAALCALQGPLHGGAPGPVLDLLDELKSNPRAMEDKLEKGERLMGFGHRVYRVRDPRAEVLKNAYQSDRLAQAQIIEMQAQELLKRYKPHQDIKTNVEFYTATLLEALDIPRELFTAVFAMGRVAGWLAHVKDQEENGRLIRPT